MRKQLLTGILTLGTLLGLNAQTVVWSDNFDDEDITNWTLVDADEDTFNWSAVQIVDEDGEPVGTPVMRSASWVNDGTEAGQPLSPDNWAITPAVDLSSFSMGTDITLNWMVKASDASFDAENYTVYVGSSSDYEDLLTSEVTFTEVLSGVNVLTARSLDVSSFAGQTIYIGFRHHNVTNEFTMEIDDVSVVEGDVAGLNQVLASKFSVYPNPASNVVTVNSNDNILVSGVEIVDINGRTVKTAKFDGVSSAQINISDIASGIYMMNISSDKGTTTKKIVKN